MNDILYLSKLKNDMEEKLLDLKRLKTFNSIMKFMDTIKNNFFVLITKGKKGPKKLVGL